MELRFISVVPVRPFIHNDENEVTAEHTGTYDNGFGICSVCGDKLYEPATLNANGEYEIGNAGQLCWFAGLVNGTLNDGTKQNMTAKGVLTDNIDLASVSNWTPIGNESNKFDGTFDGKNFKVQNLSITQQGNYTGLFGYASGATMQNICIDGNITLNTTSYTEGYGSIVGCMVNSTIINCHSSVNFSINTVMNASENCIGHMGGIVGKMDESKSTDSNVSGCSYSGTMNLGNNKVNVAAGIVGYAIYSDVPITNCSFTGTIKSKCEDALIMGGIFGYTRSEGNVKVTNCQQAGTLEKTGNSSLTGILIGQINTGYGANAVTNNYYTASTFNVIGSTTGTPTTTPATQCSTKQLQSGEICYLLNGSSPYGEWGQKLGTDSYPVPGSDNTVYRGYKNCLNITYSNDQEELSENPIHDYDNGICKACKAYQPATLTTDKYDIDGDDTKDEVYEIGNAGQLYWFAGLVNGDKSVCDYDESTNTTGTQQDKAAWAVLTANIEVSGTWTPIIYYNGTFDGKGYTISGLKNENANSPLGLFGTIGNNSEIRNVGIVNCEFSGTLVQVGGVCGENYGTIENCYTTGSINTVGEGCNGGGVCGENFGIIKNCYNTGTVDGNLGKVGGVCGLNTGTIENCYNTGSVYGQIGGGVCGRNNGTITNCYYLSGTATGGIGQNFADVPVSAEVKTAAQFASGEVCYLLQGSQSSPVWGQQIGSYSEPVLGSNKTVYRGYKFCILTYSNDQEELSENPVHDYDNGICETCIAYQPATLTTDKYDINGDNTKDNVYEIGNAGQLYWFAGLVNGDASVCDYDEESNQNGTQQNKAACAVLTANIVVNSGLAEGETMLGSLEYDASGNVTNGSNFVAWTPIGFNYPDYTGTFDGKGYTVSGLYFNDISKSEVGLFGHLGSGGKISNVGVLDSYFQFNAFGGGVCGWNTGEINNCYSFSTVISPDSFIGGVCGYNFGGKILNSYNYGIVSGHSYTGGVCGENKSNGEITNCYNSGTVSGTGTASQIAGVCGSNDSNCTISGCYNTGAVSGENSGGVCEGNNGTIKNCYNTGTVSGQIVYGGVCGTNEATVTSCYNSGAVNGTVGEVGGICGNIGDRSSTTNCYYDSNIYSGNAIGEDFGGTVGEDVMGKTTAQFNSGEVCYLLNGSSPYGEWGQQIDTNDYPVLGSAYKVLRAARDGENGTHYWATFSNLNSNAELTASTGEITVYNATVSAGTLTLTKRSDNKVAMEEGVLLKANCEYLNAKNISDEVSAAATGENHLVATPKDAEVINAETGYTLYRLTYNDVESKEGLGFYLGLVGESKDGSQLKATPGKAYLNVLTSEAKLQSSAAPARGFAFPGDDDATGIECITVTDEELHRNGNAKGIYDLQGRKVSKPTKGVYIKNNKLFLN